MYINKTIGKIGEDLACQYLRSSGYKIVENNFFYHAYGEIDIIAKKNRELIFVEVKTRTNNKFGRPAEAVNSLKQKHMYQTAKYYLHYTRQENIDVRFDVIEVFINNGKIRIHHIKQII